MRHFLLLAAIMISCMLKAQELPQLRLTLSAECIIEGRLHIEHEGEVYELR